MGPYYYDATTIPKRQQWPVPLDETANEDDDDDDDDEHQHQHQHDRRGRMNVDVVVDTFVLVAVVVVVDDADDAVDGYYRTNLVLPCYYRWKHCPVMLMDYDDDDDEDVDDADHHLLAVIMVLLLLLLIRDVLVGVGVGAGVVAVVVAAVVVVRRVDPPVQAPHPLDNSFHSSGANLLEAFVSTSTLMCDPWCFFNFQTFVFGKIYSTVEGK